MEGIYVFNALSIIFKYIFIIIIYLFIFSIIRLIYLDIRSMDSFSLAGKPYLKLLNRRDTLSYKVRDHYIVDDKLTLGRDKHNNIVLKDPFISKNHMMIVQDEENYFLEDLNSANGTYINRQKVEDVVSLKNGDVVEVGNVEFLFVNKE